MMNRKRWLFLSLSALAVLILVLVVNFIIQNRPDRYEDRETLPRETFITQGDASVAYTTRLKPADIANTPAADWLAACSGEDRNEQFDAYALRHRATTGESTTFTYLVYYRNADSQPTAAPVVEQGESEWRVNLTFSTAQNPDGYSLVYLAVTIPTAEAPYLRLVHDGESVGLLVTESGEPIPQPAAGQ